MDSHQKEVAMPHPASQGLIQCLLWIQISTILISAPCKCDAVMHGPFGEVVWRDGFHFSPGHLKEPLQGSVIWGVYECHCSTVCCSLLLPVQQDVFLQGITDLLQVTRMGREKEMTYLVSPTWSCHSCSGNRLTRPHHTWFFSRSWFCMENSQFSPMFY